MGAQTILVTGALVLFGMLLLTIHQSLNRSGDTTFEAAATMAANSLAQQRIDEISSRAFDENTISAAPADPSGFSASLTKESGEVYPGYDDVDDYNGFSRIDTVEGMILKDSVWVSYVNVDASNPNASQLDTPTLTKTRTKKITVRVSIHDARSTFFKNPLHMYYYKSY